MNKKQVFLMVSLLVVSGDMFAGRGDTSKKWKKKREKIERQQQYERDRAASQASLEDYEYERSRSGSERSLQDDIDPWGLREGGFVNPNHRKIDGERVEPDTSNTALPKRARKKQREFERQLAQIAAASDKTRS